MSQPLKSSPEFNDPGTEAKLHRQFSYKRVWWIIFLSLLLSGYLIYVSFDINAFRLIEWTGGSLLFIFLGFVLMALRQLMYMYRLRLITGKQLSWRQSYEVITLWLFSSAVTPSAVGGAAVAVYLMKKEGLSVGKSATTSMMTVFLDQAFFAIMAPVMTLLVGRHLMFAQDAACRSESELPLGLFHDIETIYYVSYFFYLLVVLGLAYGLLINAGSFKTFLKNLFSLPFLKRWKEAALKTGDDIMATSGEIKGHSPWFWIRVFSATFLSWIAFFSICLCILAAFFDIESLQTMVVYARQAVIWMITIIPTTPGGAGVAEISFSALMCDLTGVGLVPIMALLWRMITYYPYLVLGIAFLPRWMKRVYSR
jgi:uncharacterized membrane protein YbhN (UPF0104 family)